MRTYLFRRNQLTKRAETARKRSLKLGVKGYFTRKTIENLYVKQSGRCACPCNELLEGVFDVDHIIPLSRGGDNMPKNLQLLKPFCNKSKGSKTMEEFVENASN